MASNNSFLIIGENFLNDFSSNGKINSPLLGNLFNNSLALSKVGILYLLSQYNLYDKSVPYLDSNCFHSVNILLGQMFIAVTLLSKFIIILKTRFMYGMKVAGFFDYL
jgi:hypothetical protein